MMTSGAVDVRTILVIDDDVVVRDVLSLTLGLEGHTVSTAASGEEALSLLAVLQEQDKPSTILADLQMPGLSGAELARELRSVCAPGTILLSMSGSRPKRTEIALYSGFLLKPFTTEDLAAALGKSDSKVMEASKGSGSQAIKVLDEAIYSKLSATMPPAQVKALYVMCINDATARVARMRTASSASDAIAFTKEAHALRGGCGMLGAVELYALAGQMETGALSCTPLLDDFTLAVARLRRMLEARS